jgi:hypothetical protein
VTAEPAKVTWEELRQHAEASWRLEGPNSAGGKTLYRYQGRLFVVGYGDFSSLPGGAEQVIGERPDNTPGFPPDVGGGHAAGCAHEKHWDWDWWLHKTCLLRVQNDDVILYEDAKEAWRCPLPAFAREDSPRRQDVLRKLGPVVLDEAVRCALARMDKRPR